jgi:hypothetical protein
MDPTQLPSLADLTGAMGAWNPQAYLQAQQNLDLNQQFLQQGLQQKQQENEKINLQNQFDAANNPNKLQTTILDNTSKQNANVISGLGAERARANQQNLLDEDQRKAVINATDDEMKQFDQHVGQLLRSNDPNERLQGATLQTYIPAFQEARRVHQESLDKIKLQTDSAQKVEGMRAGSNERIAQMNIDAGKFNRNTKAGGAVLDIQQAVQQGKMTAEKAAVALHGAAMFASDPDEAKKYQDMASQYENFAMNQRNAQAGGKPDLAKLGVAVQEVSPALGQPSEQPVARQKTAPPAAIQYLQQHPESRAAFQAKYGYLP